MSTHKEKSRKKKGRRVGKEDRHTQKKRTHVKKACIHCRNGHLRCDDSRPCTQCVKRNISCTDQPNAEGLASSLPTGVKRDREDSEREDNSVDSERPAKRLCPSPPREREQTVVESPLSSPASSPKPSPLRSSARILRSSLRSSKRSQSSSTLSAQTSPSSRPSPSPSCSVSPASSNGLDVLNVSSDCIDVDINASVDNTNSGDSNTKIVQHLHNTEVKKTEEIPKDVKTIVNVNQEVAEQDLLQVDDGNSSAPKDAESKHDVKTEPSVLQRETPYVERKQPEVVQQPLIEHSQNRPPEVLLKSSQVQAQEGFFFDFDWELANASTTETDSGDSDTLVQDVDIYVEEMYLPSTGNSNFLPPIPQYSQEPSEPSPQSISPSYSSNSFCFCHPWSNSDSRNWDGDDIKW